MSIISPSVIGNNVNFNVSNKLSISIGQPFIIWNKTYGGNLLDWGWSISKTSYGGFNCGGEIVSFSAGDYDAFLIKTDSNGDKEWTQTFGGSLKQGCRAVKQTDDQGYILAGYTDSYGYPDHDFWLIRTNEIGNELQNYTYGGQSSDAAVSVIQTSNGDFVMTGYSYTYTYANKDVWVVKTDQNGIEQWNHNYGGIEADQGLSIVESIEGGYVIAGFTSSFGQAEHTYGYLKLILMEIQNGIIVLGELMMTGQDRLIVLWKVDT